LEPDAPLPRRGTGRPPARDHAPVSTRQNRRSPRRHPLGRCGQEHPGDRMSFAARLEAELEQFKQQGVYKRLNHLEGPQAARTRMEGRGEVVILSSNNYLGLCNEPEVVAGGKRALDQFGAGTGSVRFICGTFAIHRELEQALARFVGCESALSYVSCWKATSPSCPTSPPWRDATAPWWPWTTRMAPACWAARAEAPPSTIACSARWTSSRRRWARRWGEPRAASPPAQAPSPTISPSAR